MTDQPVAGGVMTVGELTRVGTAWLARAGIGQAGRETVWLLERALGMTALDLRLNESRTVAGEALSRARQLLARRASREPLQYLLGTQEFCGLEFEVNQAVLIPRPETELLVETALRCAGSSPATRRPVVADIGTGSGCIAVALATRLPRGMVYAVDCSREALRVACRNADRLGAADRVVFLEGDLLAPLEARGLGNRLDLIVANPPYIAERNWDELQPEVRLFEPRIALAGGHDGLAVYRRLVPAAARGLRTGGWLVMEVGQGQAEAVRALIEATGCYGPVEVFPDQAGILRVVCAQLISCHASRHTSHRAS